MTARGERRTLARLLCPEMVLALLLVPGAAAAGPRDEPVWEQVVARAAARSREPHRPPDTQLPPALARLDYDGYRAIRYRPEARLWRGERFSLGFFLRGYLFRERVALHVVEPGRGKSKQPAWLVEDLSFSPGLFDFRDKQLAAEVPRDLGFAGFRLYHRGGAGQAPRRLAEFLGASYFRLTGGVGQARGKAGGASGCAPPFPPACDGDRAVADAGPHPLGASARGLALDTVTPTGEEFPLFSEFWLVHPPPGAEVFLLYALLESPSVSGAYRFEIRPQSAEVRQQVEAVLYVRRAVQKLGLAPLTSMYLYGENTPRPPGFSRPEVHDSDGLSLHLASGEWLWRPLQNARRVTESVFAAEQPRGFGLMQRDRCFAHHEDLKTRYDRRPSVWVEPRGSWGKGHVTLVELPSEREWFDNVVVFWVPEPQPRAGDELRVSYTLRWQGSCASRPPGHVLQTLAGWEQVEVGGAGEERRPHFTIDFVGPALTALPAGQPPEAVVTVGTGSRVLQQLLRKNPVTGGWRLELKLTEPPPETTTELRVFLRRGRETLTETWSYGVRGRSGSE